MASADQQDFPIEYAFSQATDVDERLDQVYDLILDLILASKQIPEEDTVDASPNGSDAGEIIHASPIAKSRPLGELHAIRS